MKRSRNVFPPNNSSTFTYFQISKPIPYKFYCQLCTGKDLEKIHTLTHNANRVDIQYRNIKSRLMKYLFEQTKGDARKRWQWILNKFQFTPVRFLNKIYNKNDANTIMHSMLLFATTTMLMTMMMGVKEDVFLLYLYSSPFVLFIIRMLNKKELYSQMSFERI